MRSNRMPLSSLEPSPRYEMIVGASGGYGERVETGSRPARRPRARPARHPHRTPPGPPQRHLPDSRQCGPAPAADPWTNRSALSAHDRPRHACGTRRCATVSAILLLAPASRCSASWTVSAKLLAGDYPVVQIVWARYAFAIPVMLAAARPSAWPRLLRCARPSLQAARAMMPVLANVTVIVGLSLMPLADATAISFASPLLVVALSAPLLGERSRSTAGRRRLRVRGRADHRPARRRRDRLGRPVPARDRADLRALPDPDPPGQPRRPPDRDPRLDGRGRAGPHDPAPALLLAPGPRTPTGRCWYSRACCSAPASCS